MQSEPKLCRHPTPQNNARRPQLYDSREFVFRPGRASDHTVTCSVAPFPSFSTSTKSAFTMHRCLQIYEILHIISSHLIQLKLEASLAALARTCKAIEGPALDCLWHDQETIYNILSCMPRDLFDVYADKSGSQSKWGVVCNLSRPQK